MKATVLSLGLLVTTSGVAFAQAPAPIAPSSPPPTPVELPEEPEQASPPPAAPPAPTAVRPNAAPPPAVAPPSAQPANPPSAPPPALAPAPMPPPRAMGMGAPVIDTQPEKPRGPITSRFNIGINIDSIWYTGKSFDFFSDHNNVTTPGVSVGYAVVFDAPLSIVPEIGWSTSKASASNLYGGAFSQTQLTTQTGYAGLSLRFGILSFLETHTRVAGGVSFLDATAQTTGATGQLEDKGASPFGSLGGGLTVHTPAGSLETQSGAFRSVVAGITVEGGYVMGGSVDLTPTPTGEPGRVATTYLPMGTLERSGPYIRTALSVRF